jgi:transposase
VERLGDVALILSKLDLDDIEAVIWEPYHREGAGRPPRNPVGIFKALVAKRLRQIPSDRELYRRLWNDPLLREICDIEDRERPYHPSQLTRFRRRVGPERLEGIVKELVEELVEGGVIDGETVAMDASFIKAWSRRDPHDNSRGYSDPDARVGRDDRSYSLGYRAHIAADADSDLPVAFTVAPANENEKKHAPDLLDKTVEATKGRAKRLVADPQYSSRRFRGRAASCGVEVVIPYPRNQRRDEDVLRVDRRFRVHGLEHEVRVYGRSRSSIERVNSRLEELVCLNRHRLRGLRSITVHTALCIIAMLLVAVAALRLGVPEKTRCIASFGWR